MRASYKKYPEMLVNQLLDQLSDIARQSRAGWVKTRRVRYHQVKPFIHFLGSRFRLKDIRDIQPMHVQAYIKYRLENEKVSDKTVFTDISTIRFWHRQIPMRRYLIPINKLLLGELLLNGQEFRQKW
ncbi:hypothetical protein Dtox_1414 [Desulfofarcimen acetoxidans DSM 771]|uniref:Core-binding (CB) domain-containing protein n=1 Tax=Desulfofarcimen acetoxidans (strain ATCC 49208 / DSM 771 / KCTC 5769 / VKM B-1644 / 5575) TaxID=485916 RepID=C8VVH4_DESAS|nr:phage integrase N-terminal domain-containing protein [Desulfofarcimen acetoxidans]ACV62289.1 hypothetical protein Dtox_1414 [Desulfofarcimen acetoxidans DSM 771]